MYQKLYIFCFLYVFKYFSFSMTFKIMIFYELSCCIHCYMHLDNDSMRVLYTLNITAHAH